MIVVPGTRAFRDLVAGPAAGPDDTSTTVPRAWYATVLLWRRPVALFVNDRTLLPLVMPLAPAKRVSGKVSTARPQTTAVMASPA